MKSTFRIALAQINPVVGDLRYNEELIARFIRKADKNTCDIILFPELSLSGYPPEDLLHEPQFIRDCEKHKRRIAKLKSKSMAVIGYPEKDGKRLYNSSALIVDGKVAHVYRKVCLPNYGVFDEKRYFAAGSEIPLYKLSKFNFGINICEDIWINPGPADLQATAGAGLVLTINSSPYHIRKSRERISMLTAYARRNKVYYGYVNLVGGQDELVFDGCSVMIDPNGKVVALGEMFEEDLLIVDLPVSELEKWSNPRRLSQRLQQAADRFPEIEPYDISYKVRRKSRRIKSRRVDKPVSREEEIYRALLKGTEDYIDKNGFTDVLIGLSGGIDSALTATIAHDVVGSDRLHLVFMPTVYTLDSSYRGARKLAQNLEVKLIEYQIDELFDGYKSLLQPEFEGLTEGTAEENIQARIRGNLLMALANKFNWLVLTTGNKSEVAVGYCTLYGDTAGGFSVLKDVYKTMVFRLAKWRNRMERSSGGSEIIPRIIINKPPSAELRAEQQDTDSLPPYDVLDPILKRYVEKGESPREIAGLGHDINLVKRIIRLVDIAEYKRRQAAPGVRITPRALGKDRRMPITNRYRFE